MVHYSKKFDGRTWCLRWPHKVLFQTSFLSFQLIPRNSTQWYKYKWLLPGRLYIVYTNLFDFHLTGPLQQIQSSARSSGNKNSRGRVVFFFNNNTVLLLWLCLQAFSIGAHPCTSIYLQNPPWQINRFFLICLGASIKWNTPQLYKWADGRVGWVLLLTQEKKRKDV